MNCSHLSTLKHGSSEFQQLDVGSCKTHRYSNAQNLLLWLMSMNYWLCWRSIIHVLRALTCLCSVTSRHRSVIQAVSQLLPFLQSGHGQLQVLLQSLDLSLISASHPAQLLVHLSVSLAGQFFLHVEKLQLIPQTADFFVQVLDLIVFHPEKNLKGKPTEQVPQTTTKKHSLGVKK